MGRSAQLNVRLKADHLQALEAQAYLEGCSTADLARRVLEAHVKSVVDRREIRQAMEARARYQGIEDGSVRSLGGPSSTAT